jgi:hypothetical protein
LAPGDVGIEPCGVHQGNRIWLSCHRPGRQ